MCTPRHKKALRSGEAMLFWKKIPHFLAPIISADDFGGLSSLKWPTVRVCVRKWGIGEAHLQAIAFNGSSKVGQNLRKGVEIPPEGGTRRLPRRSPDMLGDVRPRLASSTKFCIGAQNWCWVNSDYNLTSLSFVKLCPHLH